MTRNKLLDAEKSPAQILLDRLRAGEDMDELYLELLPAGERELLRRLALVRQFDERLVDEVLRPGVAGGSREEVPFARLLRDATVQRWPRTDSYYMHPAARSARLSPAARAERRDIEVALAAYWERRGDAVEHLYHLLAVDLPIARALFCILYAEADDKLDLPRCYDLICILRERVALLDSELLRLLHEKEAHLRVRNEERYRRYQAACQPCVDPGQNKV